MCDISHLDRQLAEVAGGFRAEGNSDDVGEADLLHGRPDGRAEKLIEIKAATGVRTTVSIIRWGVWLVEQHAGLMELAFLVLEEERLLLEEQKVVLGCLAGLEVHDGAPRVLSSGGGLGFDDDTADAAESGDSFHHLSVGDLVWQVVQDDHGALVMNDLLSPVGVISLVGALVLSSRSSLDRFFDQLKLFIVLGTKSRGSDIAVTVLIRAIIKNLESKRLGAERRKGRR